jgi:hypothetical protein
MAEPGSSSEHKNQGPTVRFIPESRRLAMQALDFRCVPEPVIGTAGRSGLQQQLNILQDGDFQRFEGGPNAAYHQARGGPDAWERTKANAG